MNRKLVSLVASSVLALTAVLAPSEAKADPVVLKVGTLAPQQSPWGQVFSIWQKGLKERTHGAVELQFFWNGTQGDEGAMVGKIRNGQLDGAALTATGLSQFNRDVLALQLPGLYGDWGKLDQARQAIKGQIEAEMDKQKVKILGWGDVGIAHIMSKGSPVRNPEDLKTHKPYSLPGDPIGRSLMTRLGVPITTVQVPEILPGLTSGRLDVVNAPALAAEQLQWASRLEHINTMPSGIGIGALVFSADKINALPADVKEALVQTGEVAGKALTGRIRREDAAAFDRIKKKLTPYEPNEGDKAQWSKLFQQVRQDVCGPTIKADICSAVSR